jgi:F0F1-type ATP synthase assembly protein I
MDPDKKAPKKPWAAMLWAESLRALSLGWDLAIPIFGGVLLGQFIDQKIGTDYIFTVGLLFFGISVSYYNLWKFVQKMKRIDDKKKKDEQKDKTQKD